MTASNFPQCLAALLVHEGGNDDDPRDPGGRTSRGITQSEYSVWRAAQQLPAQDVWLASDAEVRAIYNVNYWGAVKADQLPSGVDYCVFDYAVNSGVSRSAKTLQLILGIPQDGVIGPQTLAAAGSASAQAVIKAICDQRLAFLQGLSTWATFGRGWATRVSDVRAMSLRLAGTPTADVPKPAPAPIPPRQPDDPGVPLPRPRPPVPTPMPSQPSGGLIAFIIAAASLGLLWASQVLHAALQFLHLSN